MYDTGGPSIQAKYKGKKIHSTRGYEAKCTQYSERCANTDHNELTVKECLLWVISTDKQKVADGCEPVNPVTSSCAHPHRSASLPLWSLCVSDLFMLQLSG